MGRSALFEQLPREQALHQQVVQRLRDAIAQGSLAVGDHLPSERELCEQLGVSRTIVREAIRVLASEGMLQVSQGRRALVTADLSTTSLQPMRQLIEDTARKTFSDVLDARLILEVAGAERAAQKASAQDLAELGTMLDAMRAAAPGTLAATQAHSEFHRAVARASHNYFLAQMIATLLDVHIEQQQVIEEDPRDMALLPIGYEAHARLFRPIRDHRPAVARRVMAEHLSTTIHRHPNLHR
jgi:GntR family transcriptional repressor for pyruvate dehydrogenase complex